MSLPIVAHLFATKTTAAFILIADAAATSIVPAELAPIANLGAMGCVLLWFMLRSEPRMQRHTEAIDRLTKMNGYVVIALETVHPAVKKQVQAIIDEVQEAETKRKK